MIGQGILSGARGLNIKVLGQASALTDQNISPQVPEPGVRFVDPVALARRSARLERTTPVAVFERLCSALAAPDGDVHWVAEFSQEVRSDNVRLSWLALRFDSEVQFACSLCAEPMPVTLDAERRFLFVRDDDEAARLDELAEDHDVLAAEERFDLLDLVEDELILALPLLMHHDVCPEASGADAMDAPEPVDTQQPFADLAAKMAALGGKKAD